MVICCEHIQTNLSKLLLLYGGVLGLNIEVVLRDMWLPLALPVFCWLVIDPVTDAVIPTVNPCLSPPAALCTLLSPIFCKYFLVAFTC